MEVVHYFETCQSLPDCTALRYGMAVFIVTVVRLSNPTKQFSFPKPVVLEAAKLSILTSLYMHGTLLLYEALVRHK
jgi:hypothetical protein